MNEPRPTPATPKQIVKEFESERVGETTAQPNQFRPETSHPAATSPRYGRFAVQRFHARGGLGEVHVAADEELHRNVALKRMREHCVNDRAARRRFLNEAEITARLEHPGIVPIYGLVRDEKGEPCYAMRFIEGESLADATKKWHGADGPPDFGGLPFRRLLQSFISICNTVAYAHSKRIVHRDLKPANVMLGPFGETLVVDWGLAREMAGGERPPPEEPLEEDILPSTVNFAASGSEDRVYTQAGQALGTLGYMAPEQAAGRWNIVGSCSDIYSLGATLYEMLTSQRPIRGGDRLAALQNAQAGQFPAPRQVKADVPRALEAICLKAMALQPEDRYTTAKELAADLEHWLAGEPVAAWREPWAVRARRWVRRRRTVVVGAAVLLATVVVGLAVGLYFVSAEKNRTEEARVQAQKRLVQIEKNNEILTAIFTDLDIRKVKAGSEPLEAVLAGRLVKAAAQLEEEAVGDALVVAGLQNRLGETLLHLGYAQQATPLFVKARATYSDKRGADHPNTLVSMSFLAASYEAAGKFDLAVPLFEETYKLRKGRLGPNHPDTLVSMRNLAIGYRSAGKLDRALPLLQETLKLTKATLGADHSATIECMNNLAVGYQAAGELELALPLYQQTFEHRKATLGADHPDTLATMNDLAAGYRAVGKLDEALPLLEETLRLMKAKLGAEHPNTAGSMGNLAAALRAAGKLDLALPLLIESHRLLKAKLGVEHPNTLASMANLAEGYQDTGELDLALPLLEETFNLRKATLGADHPDTLTSMNNLAMGYRAAGKLDLAVSLLKETLKITKAKLGPGHPQTLGCMNNLAGGYFALGKLDQAIPLLDETLQIRKAKLGPDHPDTLLSMNNLARACFAADKPERALALYQQAAAGVEKGHFQHEFAGRIINNLSGCHEKLKQFDQAEPWRRKWLAVVKERSGAASISYADEESGLGLNLLQQKNWTEAESVLRECLAIREKVQPDEWSTFNTQSMLGGALLGQQKYGDAEALLLKGYDGMQQRRASIPDQFRGLRLTDAVERLVQLYEALGKSNDAAKWKEILADLQQKR